jgi:hypothetical protein
MKYQVKSAFIGVYRQNDGTSEFVTVEPGAFFALRGQVRGGFVNIMYQARILAVFMKDVEERAVKIRGGEPTIRLEP